MFLSSNKYALFLKLFLLFVLILTGCNSLSTAPTPTILPTPSPTPPAEFSGRLLLLSSYTIGFTVWEFRAGMDSPQALWARLPGSWDRDASYREKPIISASGNYAILPGEHAVVDLTNGNTIQLPNYLELAPPDFNFFGVFSPTDDYLAYGGLGGESSKAVLYVVNLKTLEVKVLFEGPCESYLGIGPSIVCGWLTWPGWIDNTTLIYSAYVGDMPDHVTYPGAWEARPNQSFLVDISNAVITELPGGFFESLNKGSVAGSTVLVSVPGSDQCGWVEAADIQRDVIEPNPLGPNCPSLSPDGRYALYYLDDTTRRLVELRTDWSTWLLADLGPCHDLLWSPDGKSIACRSFYNWAGGGSFYMLPFDSSDVRVVNIEGLTPGDWEPLAWLP